MKETGASARDAVLQALPMATLNPARYLQRYLAFRGLPRTGEIAPGCSANLVILDSLEDVSVEAVIHRGKTVVSGRSLTADIPVFDYSSFTRSINLDHRPVAGDFTINAPCDEGEEAVRVIEIVPGSLLTRSGSARVNVRNGKVEADPEQDLARVAVFERHHATGARTLGFIKGLGLKRGAVASTVAHDSHNLIVAGTDDAEMARAACHLMDHGGGIVIILGEEVHYLPLAIGGLMSTEPVSVVVSQYRNIKEAAQRSGTGLDNIFMTLSFTALPVIPELRITDRGLVDVIKFQVVPLFP